MQISWWNSIRNNFFLKKRIFSITIGKPYANSLNNYEKKRRIHLKDKTQNEPKKENQVETGDRKLENNEKHFEIRK